MKSAMIHARIEPDLKRKVEELFALLGLSVTEAITLFYKQVELQNGLPFEVRIPTPETEETFQNTDAGRDLTSFDTADDLIRDLGI